MRLTPHLHVLQRLRVSGAVTLLPVLVFVACVEKTSPFVPNMIAPLYDMQPTLG